MLSRIVRARRGVRLVASIAALVLLGVAARAHADVLVLRDGTVLPKGLTMKPGEVPSQADLVTAHSHVADLAYDLVKAGGKDHSAGQVRDAFIESAEMNEAFREGEVRGSQGFWQDAAESYARAAGELKGSAKQVALYKQALTLANVPDVDGMLATIDALLAEFPKSYFFGPVQQKRALALASKGKMAEAVAALKTVSDAPGMNARDLFEAEYTRLWLTKMMNARSPGDFAAAEKEFRGLVEAIDRHARGKTDANDQRLKAMARVGKALVLQNKAAEGRKVLDDVVSAATKNTDPATLGAAYTARGDALFAAAKAVQAAGKKDEATTLAKDAVEDYHRVLLMYGEAAEAGDVFNARQNLARVYRSLFALSGDKDCELASRAYTYYREAAEMLDGEEKRVFVREGLSLKEAMDKACGTGTPTPPPAGGSGG